MVIAQGERGDFVGLALSIRKCPICDGQLEELNRCPWCEGRVVVVGKPPLWCPRCRKSFGRDIPGAFLTRW